MKRLYLQFYLTIIASLVAVVLIAGILFRVGAQDMPIDKAFRMVGEIAAAAVPPADAPAETQQRAISRLAERLQVDLSLFDAGRRRIAEAGNPLPVPGRFRRGGGWLYGMSGPAWSIRLPDGRWLVAAMPGERMHPGFMFLVFLGGAALVVGIVAFPVVRRVTRRLEGLQASVDSLGSGDLSARVKVEGRDEVARLAASFNRAAERIETLVGGHKMLLANASHELRTPLARIRLGIELLKGEADPKRKAELEADIAELDQLIDEILLASRLDAVAALEIDEEVDLLALAAEECARCDGASAAGVPVMVRGDGRLLRRMIRNLLVNAGAHGKPPISIEVRGEAGQAVLRICDHGPGIPEADRERLFVPFHHMAATPGRSGAGLGLALVKQIALRHSGDVVYGAGENNTSCFTVTLPIAKPAM